MITIVIPTVTGREEWLDRAVRSFSEHTADLIQFLVYENRPTCGTAWNEGIVEAEGDWVLLAADDLEAHAGWDTAAVACVRDRHALPCPRILNPDGTLQSCGNAIREDPDGADSDVARVPFLPRTLALALHPVFPNPYAGDYWITWKARQHGWPTQVTRDMTFTHHLVHPGRLNTLEADWRAFKRATRPPRKATSKT